MGGSCQRPRPLTDEGKPYHCRPQAGCHGRLGPHPAPRGKTKQLQNSNISLPNLQSCVARTIIVDVRLSRTGNKCKKDPSGGYKQHEEQENHRRGDGCRYGSFSGCLRRFRKHDRHHRYCRCCHHRGRCRHRRRGHRLHRPARPQPRDPGPGPERCRRRRQHPHHHRGAPAHHRREQRNPARPGRELRGQR